MAKSLGILGADNVIYKNGDSSLKTVKYKKGMKYYDNPGILKKKKKDEELNTKTKDIRTIKNDKTNNQIANNDGYIKTNQKYGDYDYHDYKNKKDYDIYKKDNKSYYYDPKSKTYVDMDMPRMTTKKQDKKELKEAKKYGYTGKKVYKDKDKKEQVLPTKVAEQVELETSGLTKKEKEKYSKSLIRQEKKSGKDSTYVREGNTIGELKNITKNIDEKAIEPLARAPQSYDYGKLSQELSLAYYDKLRGKKNNIEEIQRKIDNYNKFNQDIINSNNMLDTHIKNLPNQVGGIKAGIENAGPLGAIGAIGGGAIGAVATKTPTGALVGAEKGAKLLGGTGYVKGQAENTYKLEAGATYQTLLEMGVPDEIAKKEAKRAGTENALIESGESILDLLTLGRAGVATNALKEGLIKKYGAEALKKWGVSYATNIASEGLQEGTQEQRSIAAEKRAAKKAGIERDDSQDAQRILESTKAGAFSAGLTGAGTRIAGMTGSNVYNTTREKATQMLEIQQQVENGTMPVEEANKKIEQVNNGTYQQNKNLDQIATQQRDAIEQAVQTGQLSQVEATQEMEALNNTLTEERNQISRDSKIEAMQETIQQMDVNGYISKNYTNEQLQEFMDKVYDDNLSNEELQQKIYEIIFKDSAKKQATNVLDISAKDTKMTKDEFIKRHYNKNLEQDFGVSKEEVGKIYDKYHKEETSKSNYEQLRKDSEREVVKTISEKSGKKGRSYQGRFYSDEGFSKLNDDDIKLSTKLMKKLDNQQKLTKAEEKQIEYLRRKREGLKNPELNPNIKSFEDIKSDYKYASEYNFSKEDKAKINKALDIVSANKQGRRTKQQWLDIATNIGMQSENLDSEGLKNLAFGSFSDLAPNQKNNLNRQGQKYVPFSITEWVKAVYKGAGVGTKIKEENIQTTKQEQPKQEIQQETQQQNVEEKQKAKKSYRDYDKKIRELEDNQYDLEEYIKDNEDYHSDNEEIEAEYQQELNEKKAELEKVNKELSELQKRRETQYLKEIQGLPNPTQKTEFEGFSSTDTDFPFANEILNAKGEERKNILKHEKLRDAYVVEMTPKEYLENAGKYGWNSILSYEEISKQMGERNQKNIDEMAEAIKKGDKLPMPYLEIGADSHNQEGRHRAFAAEKAGLKTIPVLIMEKNTKIIDDTAPKKSENIPATKSENVITIKNDNLKDIPKDQIKGEDTGVSIDGKEVQMEIPIDSKPNKLGQYVPKDGFTNKELKSGKLGDSKFYKNVTERADFINDKVREKIKNDDYIEHYRKVTNEESMQEAFNDLNTRGTEAIADFFNNDKELTSKDTAMGWLLIAQSQENGDYDFSNQVLRKMRSNATKTGQTMQMYNYYARLTPEGMYRWCGDQLLRAEEIFEKGKTKKWIEANKKRWQLNGEEVEFIKSQMQKVQELNQMNDNDTTTIDVKGKTKEVTVDRAKQVEIAKIQAMIENKIPPEKGKAINAWMRISMLGNLKTIGTRNPLGNIALRPVNDVGDFAASLVDYAISKKTGVRTKGNLNLKAQLKGGKKGASETVQDFRLGINTRSAKGNRFEIGEGKAFNEQHTGITKALNPISKLGNKSDRGISFLLDLGDRPFYEANYQQSLENQMRLNGIEKIEDVPDWMKNIAETEGLERTYQDDNNYTKSVIAIRKAMNMFNVKGYGLGDVIIPFAKTPANLTKAIVDYSPAGFVNAITKGKNLRVSIENGQFTPEMQHAFVNQLGKATAGTILYAVGAALASSGLITGGADEDKDVADFMKNTLGIQPYSIKVGNKSYTYDWAQPLASGLAIPADIKKTLEDAKEGEVDLEYIIHKSFSTAGSVLLEQSFLQGIKDVLGGYGDPIDNLLSEIEGLPARAIPTLFQQIVTYLDGTKRMSYGNKGIQNMKAQAQAKTPLAKDLPVYRNSLGKEVKMYGGKNNFFNVFINPANYSEGQVTESAEEIYKIYQATNKKDILPRLVSNDLKNEDGTKLTNQQKSDFLKISGDIIDDNVKELKNNYDYRNMSDEDKAEAIKGIVEYAYNKARNEITGHELSSEYKKTDNAVESGYALADYYATQKYLKSITPKKEKTTSTRNRYEELMEKGIDGVTFDKFKNYATNTRGESRTGGLSKNQKIKNYIQKLPLTAKQKAALWKDYKENQRFFTYYK